MSAEVRDDVIVATEHIKAPPEVVFPYFTDPALIVDVDRRPGRSRPAARRPLLTRHGPEPCPRRLLTVDPPYRVVFSWGIPGNESLPPGGSTVEVVLTPDGDDTMVVLTHRGLPPTHIGSHRSGWERQLGRLPAAVADPPGGD